MLSRIARCVVGLLLLVAAGVAATNCEVGHGGIYSPEENAAITLGEPFNLTFCSSAYFKTYTIEIDVVVYFCGENVGDPCEDFVSGEEVVHGLEPEDLYGYQANVTIYPVNGSPRPGQWAVGVLDHTSGYYTQGEISSWYVPVTFTSGGNSSTTNRK